MAAQLIRRILYILWHCTPCPFEVHLVGGLAVPVDLSPLGIADVSPHGAADSSPLGVVNSSSPGIVDRRLVAARRR